MPRARAQVPAGNEASPRFSPEGTKIGYFGSDADLETDDNAIYVMNADGSGATKLSAAEGSSIDFDPVAIGA